MMLKTSSGKLNPTKSLFLHFLRKQTPITLLVTAFSLLICPGTLISRLVDSYNYTYDADIRQDIINSSINYSLFTAAVAILLTIFLLIINFRFLYSKKAGDMYYTLPTTRNEMLFSGLIASVIGGLFCLTVGTGSLVIVNLLPLWEGIAFMDFAKTYLLSVFFMLFLAAFSIIFIISAGREIDAIISLVGITAGIPAIYLIAMYMYTTFAYGVSLDESYEVIYTSPFIYAGAKLLAYVLNLNVGEPEYAELSGMLKLNWVSFVSVSVLTITFLYLAIRLFKIRKSETAEQGYSFKFMPSILLGLCSVVGGFLIGLILSGGSPFDSVIFWIFYGIGALLCGVAFEAVHTRGFKTVKSAIAKGGIAIAVSVAIMASAGVLGTKEIYYIPSEEQIEKVVVNDYATFEGDFDEAINLHNAILDEYKKFGGTNSEWSLFGDYYTDEVKPHSDFAFQLADINIKYVLKNGKVKVRSYYIYNIDYTEIKDEIYAFLISDEVKLGYLKQLLEMDESGEIWGDFTRTDNEYYSGNLTMENAKRILDTYMEELRTADLTIFEGNCRHFNFSAYRNWFTLRLPYSFTKTTDLITTLLEKAE